MAPFVADNLVKVTMIYPDFAFGHDHRDYFSPLLKHRAVKWLKKSLYHRQKHHSPNIPEIP